MGGGGAYPLKGYPKRSCMGCGGLGFWLRVLGFKEVWEFRA